MTNTNRLSSDLKYKRINRSTASLIRNSQISNSQQDSTLPIIDKILSSNQKKDDVNSVQNLLKIIGDRKKTFCTFAFKSVELEDEKNLNLFVKDLVDQEKRGTMLINELWPDNNLISLMKQNKHYFLFNKRFYTAKRMMKRLANMQKVHKNQDRVTTFTNKDENDIKHKFASLNGDKRIRLEINQKFVRRESIIRQQEQIIQTMRASNTLKTTETNSSYRSEVPNMKSNFLKTFSIKSLSNQQVYIGQILKSIDRIVDASKGEKKQVDRLIEKLQNRIIENKINKKERPI